MKCQLIGCEIQGSVHRQVNRKSALLWALQKSHILTRNKKFLLELKETPRDNNLLWPTRFSLNRISKMLSGYQYPWMLKWYEIRGYCECDIIRYNSTCHTRRVWPMTWLSLQKRCCTGYQSRFSCTNLFFQYLHRHKNNMWRLVNNKK